ncbi:hypothetical protein G7024_16660 [Pseudomonas stutzeri]|uniref:Uncharacterized protein n=1 Tax=Stutzerimonas stutzeri TaxID=316 RepID=A0AA40RV15_STUST|nr:hypothetical protein [Stutzerimonas stutzeri]
MLELERCCLLLLSAMHCTDTFQHLPDSRRLRRIGKALRDMPLRQPC